MHNNRTDSCRPGIRNMPVQCQVILQALVVKACAEVQLPCIFGSAVFNAAMSDMYVS